MTPKVLIVDDNAELLALLARVFENAGYQVIQTQRGRAALEKIRSDHPDVAVVDILLPDVIGYEVASLLQRERTPFVIMTGVFKGGRQAMDARAKYGAAGYFEKPFDTQKVVEAVSALLATPPKPPVSVPGKRPETTDVDMDIDVAPQSGPDTQQFSLTGRVSVVESQSKVSATLRGDDIRFRGPVSRPPLPSARPSIPPVMSPIASPASRPNPTPSSVSPVSRPAPTPSSVSPVSRAAPTPSSVGPVSLAPRSIPPQGSATSPPSSRIGQLKDNLPQLLSAFYLAQETGELTLQRGQVRKVIYCEKGMPVFAVSNLATDRFGQFLVRTGKVQKEEFQAAALVAEKTRRRTGDVLIEMGLLTETERMYYVGQQVKAIIYGLFAWEDGNYLLSFRQRARSEMLKLDAHPARLIMRGVRKLYSSARFQRLMPDTAVPWPAQDPNFLLSDVQLESWEAMLLSRVDGTRNVVKLIEYSKQDGDLVRGLLVGLLALRILEFQSG